MGRKGLRRVRIRKVAFVAALNVQEHLDRKSKSWAQFNQPAG